MMISYFAELPDNTLIPARVAEFLEDYHFLDENPESTAVPMPEGCFKSFFLYELIGTTHMSNITGHIVIDGLAPKKYTAGKNGAGVIAIACAAVGFFRPNPFLMCANSILARTYSGTYL